MFHVGLDAWYAERVVDDLSTEPSLSMEQYAQPHQHLIFGNRDASPRQKLLCASKEGSINNGIDACFASNPQVLRIVRQLLSEPLRCAVIDDIANVVLVLEK